MKVYIERSDKTLEVEASTVKELLSKLNINPTTVLVSVDDELVTEDTKLKEENNIKLISVISGG